MPRPHLREDRGATPAPDKPSAPSALTPEQQKEFVEITTELKLLDDRRKLLLARTGDDYVTDPPKLPAKP